MQRPQISTLNFAMLLLNMFVLGGVLVLMVFQGPNVINILLAAGTAGMAFGKIGQAFTKPRDAV